MLSPTDAKMRLFEVERKLRASGMQGMTPQELRMMFQRMTQQAMPSQGQPMGGMMQAPPMGQQMPPQMGQPQAPSMGGGFHKTIKIGPDGSLQQLILEREQGQRPMRRNPNGR